ncbi:conserved hypothetical protein [Ignisphaera aggregans DSM 17230]|uniref:CopG family transcriptional regulator n=1 Tax=Ignisphaera aggregans (strain DSM 17230 / JCM 13409 / AQ1.S1) TaxID=583356 RepID=E0SSC8_IGNAA|nr:conserved hypothetical protein [Ignisphaera aggregans DSM 17230]
MSVDKIETTIVIDRRVWEEFKARIATEYGFKDIGKAVEEALKEELCDLIVVEMFSKYLENEKISLTITPIEPQVPTDASRIVREFRDEQI